MNELLVTGAAGGLGRHLHERLGGAALTRGTQPDERERLLARGARVVIHCAASARRGADRDGLAALVEDNVLLTERLLTVPHERFVLVSTIDVYSGASGPRREDAALDADRVTGAYALTKLMAEGLAARRARRPLIIRASALLGRHMRRNSLVRLLEDEPCALSLSGDSRMNFVRHEDVADFIATALERGLEGTYNAASTGTTTLAELAAALGRTVSFGSHTYDAGEVDNSRIAAVCPAFARTSRETALLFALQRQKAAR